MSPLFFPRWGGSKCPPLLLIIPRWGGDRNLPPYMGYRKGMGGMMIPHLHLPLINLDRGGGMCSRALFVRGTRREQDSICLAHLLNLHGLLRPSGVGGGPPLLRKCRPLLLPLLLHPLLPPLPSGKRRDLWAIPPTNTVGGRMSHLSTGRAVCPPGAPPSLMTVPPAVEAAVTAIHRRGAGPSFMAPGKAPVTAGGDDPPGHRSHPARRPLRQTGKSLGGDRFAPTQAPARNLRVSSGDSHPHSRARTSPGRRG